MDLPGLEPVFNFAMGSDLRSLAAWLPGGVPTMIRLARLSPDEKIRAVALRWLRLPRRIRRTAAIESLCASADVPYHQFFGDIVATTYELGIDGTRMVAAQRNATIALQALAREATGSRNGRARQRFLEATGRLPRDGRRRRTRRRGPR